MKFNLLSTNDERHYVNIGMEENEKTEHTIPSLGPKVEL